MRVHIVGPDTLVKRLFKDKGFTVAKTPATADIIVFTGGEDVNPAYYGEYPLNGTVFNSKRDSFEENVFKTNANLFFVGICRGAQFLNVLCGGRLYQDVDNHIGEHDVFSPDGTRLCEVTSTHHQMMIPNHDGRVMALARESQTRKRARGTFIGSPFLDDIEIVYYPDNKERGGVVCFQPHPEYNHKETEDLFFECLKATNDQIKEFLTPKESA